MGGGGVGVLFGGLLPFSSNVFLAFPRLLLSPSSLSLVFSHSFKICHHCGYIMLGWNNLLPVGQSLGELRGGLWWKGSLVDQRS